MKTLYTDGVGEPGSPPQVITAHLLKHKNGYEITAINVPDTLKNMGFESLLFQQICQDAEEDKIAVWTMLEEYRSMLLDYGFKLNKGRIWRSARQRFNISTLQQHRRKHHDR